MRIVQVTASDELEALYRFRYRIFVEDMGWLPPHSSGLLHDEFDESAHNYAAFGDEGQVIGSIRVVPDGLFGLPLERYAPPNALDDYRHGKTLAEFSRWAVHPSHARSLLGARLMKAGFERMELMDATHGILDASVDGKEIRLYERAGFTRMGAEYVDRYHLGAMRCVTLNQRVKDVREVWPSARPGLHRFFTSVDPIIEHE